MAAGIDGDFQRLEFKMRAIVGRKVAVFALLCAAMPSQAQPVLASELAEMLSTISPVTTVPEASDAVIQGDGFLYGQVVDERGTPNAGTTVTLTRLSVPQAEIATVSTDGEGRFRVADVRGGVYNLQTGTSPNVYRLWTDGSQPPSAASSVRLVQNTRTSPGFFSNLGPGDWACIGVGIAAAIAAPIVITQGHNPASGS